MNFSLKNPSRMAKNRTLYFFPVKNQLVKMENRHIFSLKNPKWQKIVYPLPEMNENYNFIAATLPTAPSYY